MLIIRPVTKDDKDVISKWIEQDEIHCLAGIKWEDVIAPGTYSEMVSNEDGTLLMMIRYHAALRVGIQFGPATYRIAKHSKEVVDMLKERARNIGAKEVIIRPGGNAVQFADKLGFADFTGSKIVGV